ncbi:tRNA (guanine-N(1)-)-methyltransferase [Candidatus Jidaibacter acanthamoeba]|uniref:tRNA (guanine-N(1)-)-methyltransferase n=1 Tax=Candidatus Jidaibacter acanthamoebae TaxID=86105 RepID=A0A0C1QNP6_9RICK|nr:tRNA (guanosine(37)-N1)-methyltransferase TrmD [Candidatus Jidaibacter acanthamoeba]KIE05673.1 tRNA (guanine-N(1)-)-methyltransferase [Candidatus Jidaibacter acanthamoeba]
MQLQNRESLSAVWKVSILTLFPGIYPGALNSSIIGNALEAGIWGLDVYNIRDFAHDKHKTVDDTTYGGGAGLVIKPDIMGAAIDSCFISNNKPIYYLTPRGKVFNQKIAKEIISEHSSGINIICGRYEGIDERIFTEYNIAEISMGDYVVSSGDIALFPLIDCCVRLLPGVLEKSEALDNESFGAGKFENLLEYPHFTKPSNWRGHEVPDVLLSGNHQEIEKWRLKQAEIKTKNARSDLWNQYIKGEKK